MEVNEAPGTPAPRKPCVIMLGRRDVTGNHTCNKCNNLANVYLESWVNYDYRLELQGRGLDKEKASLLSMRSSIAHQEKPDSKPYDTGYLCRIHWLETVRIGLRYESVTPALVRMYERFTPGQTMIVFDKNNSDEGTEPALALGDFPTLQKFFKVYQDVKGKL